MNNIYKVIWSKAKNCYVVASEIARSHTKSATGSEKIGGVTRRSLLASLMALSLLCGGLGVASAANGTVHVAESAAGTAEVYTTEKVDTLLKDYGKKTDVEDNKNNIAALRTTTTDQGQKITENATQIANNTDAIDKKIDTETANERFAAKVDLTALQNQVTGKVDENTFEDALEDKADKTYVDTEVGKKANKATTLTGYGITDAYTKDATDTAITTKVNEEKDARELKDTELSGRIDTLSTTVDSKVSKTDLNTTLGNYYTQAETNAAIKNAVDDEKNARENAINGEVTNRNKAIADAIAAEETKRDAAITNAKTELKEKVTEEETKRKEEDAKLEGKITENTTAINNEKAVREAADTDLSKRIGTVTEDGKYIKKSATNNVSENLKVLDTQAKTNADNIQTNANNIKNNKDEIARVNGELVKTNDYFNKELGKTNDYFNKELSKTNNHFNTELGKTNAALQATNKRTAGIGRTDTGVEADNQTVIEGKVHFDQNGNVSGVKDLQTDTIHATGEITSGGLDAKAGDIKTTGKVSAGDISTGTLETTGNATIGGNLDVTGTLNIKDVTAETIHVSKSEDNADYKSEGSIIGDGGKLSVSNEKTDKRTNITEKSELNVNEKGTVNWATSTDNATGNVTEGRSEVTADNIKNSVKKTEGGKTFGYEENITADSKVGTATDKDGNKNELTQTATGTENTVTSKDGNKSTTKQEAGSISSTVYDKDGKVKASSEMKEDGSISNNATGDMTNTVGGKLTTTVAGQATENFNGGLNTTVTGAENHTVTGKQTNTVKGGQENIISGGQTNTITGGQTNNISGDQTTTITGNKKETVTENVTEDYQKDLTTTVGGNENHEVKGTKTETVEGKVTENYKAGQATNVTGDQDITVSGTQTTTATDIKRNASSGMIDTIDNDYGTNTETKVAGKTTTDVSIKGTGEEGKYIRGANESRDYLIKGTLKNSETKTVEKTSTEITDGNGKTSATIQDKTQISGSVTNGTSSAVSNVKADSIDTAVKEGTNTSLISQKKDSITSAVGNGTTSTVIQQGDKDITIASNGGTVGIVGKDIINNATDEITNTAGTKITDKVGNNTRVIDQTSITDTVGTASRKIEDGKITDTAGDSTVTTENGKGTTFAKTGSTEFSTEAGAPTDTNIAGNHITTGRVDANELGVSDKDGANTADLSVKAGEGVKASAGNGTTTGSLDVKADEVVSSVKDASGKGSTFKQRIDKIMMESKDVSIKAEETLTNEAKVITNKASEVINNEAVNINNTATGIIKSKASEIQNQADKLISNKVGENTWENMENGKITTSIKDGAKQNLTQSDAAGTTQSTVDGGKSTVTIQNADGLADAVTDGTNTSVQNQTASAIAAAVKDGAGNENASVANATTSVNTIKSGSKANTVISTADGTSFINSEAAAPVGDGTEVKTTIKGNTITTGKVTMDYAEVMKDLGVRGNANIAGKTTTGSLEVKGESKLTGDVTMESNATVKKDLTVEGNTNLKNTKVDGTLDVTQKATFGDSVSIAKDLSVGGDVTAKSYKVGDKTYISAAGINANDQKITNVADGSISEGSKDAVNGGQLYGVKNDLEGKVNKVGANAAAMANLHPMEFDPDSKWNIAAAIGNYGSETAAALGAFYRPNDDVMVNLSTAFGTGENMVGGGVSVRLGKGGNKLSREETNALKAQVADLTARMDALLSVLNPNMSKDFPDVPENHWAYEAVSRLAGNDIVQGYPDGEFHGDRTMTRYEMAEIIYNALSRGAEAEKELVEEFKPELQAMAASEKATAEKAEG